MFFLFQTIYKIDIIKLINAAFSCDGDRPVQIFSACIVVLQINSTLYAFHRLRHKYDLMRIGQGVEPLQQLVPPPA